MKGLMKHLVLTALVVMSGAVSLPVSATQDSSHCKITDGDSSGNGTIQMQNIILTAGKNNGEPLYTTSKTVNYTCLSVAGSSGSGTYPNLIPGKNLGSNSIAQSDTLIYLLSVAGIGLKLKVRDSRGGTESNVSWETLKGGSWHAAFGSAIPPPLPGALNPSGCQKTPDGDCKYTGTATITLDLFVAGTYPGTSTVTNVPPKADVLRITSGSAVNPYTTGQLGISSFAIKILEPNLTTISEITPQVVSLGHFIKASEASLTRSGNFSVTVAQKNLPAPGQEFDLPLNIRFGNGTLSVIDNSHLALKNLDGNDNGLQLSIKDIDHGNGLIEFNKDTSMGTLTVTPTVATGRYTGHYAIEVSGRNGVEVKTGKFSGGIPVTITYS
ncbi:TPA: hypothetical protein PAP86_001036 [Salmonella enterica]|nr:hypothetical protein [Salmonella enterica]HDD2120850.1 hypothetical protein [Salmonella enterica]